MMVGWLGAAISGGITSLVGGRGLLWVGYLFDRLFAR